MSRNLSIPPLPSRLRRNRSCTSTSARDKRPIINVQQDNDISFKNSTTQNDSYLAKELMRVLQQQNRNLKEQNAFLLGKLRILSDQDSHRVDVEEKYMALADQLRSKNQDLEKQIFDLNEFMQTQMIVMNRKIAQMVQQQKQVDEIITIPQFNLPIKKQAPTALSSYIQNDQIKQKPDSETMTSREIQELGNEFNRLYQNGKKQSQRVKRKQIRRKMTEISNKIQEIIKQNEF